MGGINRHSPGCGCCESQPVETFPCGGCDVPLKDLAIRITYLGETADDGGCNPSTDPTNGDYCEEDAENDLWLNCVYPPYEITLTFHYGGNDPTYGHYWYSDCHTAAEFTEAAFCEDFSFVCGDREYKYVMACVDLSGGLDPPVLALDRLLFCLADNLCATFDPADNPALFSLGRELTVESCNPLHLTGSGIGLNDFFEVAIYDPANPPPGLP